MTLARLLDTTRPAVGSRTGAPTGHLDRATFPVPSTSHAACGFPALRAPICFARKVIAFIGEHPDDYDAAFADKFVELVDKLDPQSPA